MELLFEDRLFAAGKIRLVYPDCARFALGGAVPAGGRLVLDQMTKAKTPGLRDRREMGVVNIGAPCRAEAAVERWAMAGDTIDDTDKNVIQREDML